MIQAWRMLPPCMVLAMDMAVTSPASNLLHAVCRDLVTMCLDPGNTHHSTGVTGQPPRLVQFVACNLSFDMLPWACRLRLCQNTILTPLQDNRTLKM